MPANRALILFAMVMSYFAGSCIALRAESNTAVPPDCNKPELLTRGRPVMAKKRNDVSFGLSLERHEFKPGDEIRLHVWVDNAGNTPVDVLTCSDLELFKSSGFDIYAQDGHRLLSRSELDLQKRCPKGFELGASCGRNLSIEIPAHTCRTGDDYDFSTSLTARYDLAPGRYTLQFRKRQLQIEDICTPQTQQSSHPEPSAELTFTVQP
jgi:hypothetical protein